MGITSLPCGSAGAFMLGHVYFVGLLNRREAGNCYAKVPSILAARGVFRSCCIYGERCSWVTEASSCLSHSLKSASK